MAGDTLIIEKLSEIKKILSKTLGPNLDWIADTNLHTHGFYAFTAITDTVIASATSNTSSGTIIGKTIPAGTTFYMSCANITLTSGSIIGYYY